MRSSGTWYAYHAVAKVLNCECGYTVRGEDDDDLVEKIEQHIAAQHPALVGTVSREEFLSLAEEE